MYLVSSNIFHNNLNLLHHMRRRRRRLENCLLKIHEIIRNSILISGLRFVKRSMKIMPKFLIKEIAEFSWNVLLTDTVHQQVSHKIDLSIIGNQTPRQDEKDTALVFLSPSSTGDYVYVETPKKLMSKLKMMMTMKVMLRKFEKFL